MANPFKQYLPEDLNPKEELEENVMSSIHLKAHFASVLEFFLAILGITIQETVLPAADQVPMDKKQPKDLDEPDYFY